MNTKNIYHLSSVEILILYIKFYKKMKKFIQNLYNIKFCFKFYIKFEKFIYFIEIYIKFAYKNEILNPK